METKIKVIFEVVDDNGKPRVFFDLEEDNATMKDIALLVYNMKKIEQELIDRQWEGGESYEIEKI